MKSKASWVKKDRSTSKKICTTSRTSGGLSVKNLVVPSGPQNLALDNTRSYYDRTLAV